MFCKQCGKPIDDGQELCEDCKNAANNNTSNQGSAQTINVNVNTGNNNNMNLQPKSKVAAGLLGIFLGAFGVHNFYLGYTGKAVAQLLMTILFSILTCGITAIVAEIWGFIEGILILTGSISVDANGTPLKD